MSGIAKIEAHERTIGEIFSDLYEFEIPPYQRPYAWEKEQARELLNDLFDAIKNRDASGGLYFLGSIVLVKEPTKAQSKVIDGQQRLTTLTILLSVLRDLTTENELKFERGTYVYQRASADKGLKDRYRLLLRERDRPFFLKYVQKPDATGDLPDERTLEGSQQRIAENAKYLRCALELVSVERRNALIAFLIQRCYLVVVAVPTAEAARRIFTVLNARGLDLTPTDILKADLLERAGPMHEASLANRWEEVEQALGRDRMVELFGHIRMIYERDKPRLALDSGFRKFVQPFAGNADAFISNILEPIADTSLMLADASAIQKQFGIEAAKAVRSLHRVDNKDWMPPAILRIWRRSKEDSLAIGRFLVGLERLAYFLFVSRMGVNDRIARFAGVMDEIEPKPNKETPTEGLDLSAYEQHQFLIALSGPIYQITRICKPVLQRLDEALSSGGASYDELVSIEHVLPQTVQDGSEWATTFSDEQERSAWTHRIANLVFLTHRANARASNWDFERKKSEYFASSEGSSPFVITQGVLQTDNWTPEHLSVRQEQLLEKLRQVWRLDLADLNEQPGGFSEQKGSWQFTSVKIIDAKRDKIIQAFCLRENVVLDKKGALYWSKDDNLHAVCTVSKRYAGRAAPYWYGYSVEWRTFLSQRQNSYLVFGCLDRDMAYTVPTSEMEKYLGDLYRTPEKHWHVVFSEDESGGLDLVLKNGAKISLGKFALKL
ncbi:DUF262 domain-containing protein [soil metagenome]